MIEPRYTVARELKKFNYFQQAMRATPTRFWEKVNKDGPIPTHVPHLGKCWVWTASKKSKYGRIKVWGAMLCAHRFSWRLHNGSIPRGLLACHKCDNPRCVRPDHLFLGTNQDNQNDAVAKGRNNPPRGANHHYNLFPERVLKGERNGQAKLTADDIVSIRQLAGEGVIHRVLALAYGMSRQAITKIVLRQRWKHISHG